MYPGRSEFDTPLCYLKLIDLYYGDNALFDHYDFPNLKTSQSKCTCAKVFNVTPIPLFCLSVYN